MHVSDSLNINLNNSLGCTAGGNLAWPGLLKASLPLQLLALLGSSVYTSFRYVVFSFLPTVLQLRLLGLVSGIALAWYLVWRAMLVGCCS